MSVFYMFCVSSYSALSVGDISHAPAPASLPRDRALLLSFSLHGFPFQIVPPLVELAALRQFVFHYLCPPLGFRSRFRAFAEGRVISVYLFRVSAPGPVSQSMVHSSPSFSVFSS